MKRIILTLTSIGLLSLANAQTVGTIAGSKGDNGFMPNNGPATTVPFNEPFGIAIDASDRIFISDAANHRISVYVPNDVYNKTGYIGDPTLGGATYINQSNSGARYNTPKGMVFGIDGKLYVCDQANNTIRVMNGISFVTETQQVGTFVGEAAGVNSGGDYLDGTGTDARFDAPVDIAVDANGNFYIADNYNEVIRKVTPGGVVTTLCGKAGQTGDVDATGDTARFNNILSVEMLDNTYLLVADGWNNKIRKVNINTGEVTTFAGSGATGNVDGSAASAKFNTPSGLAVDAFGNVYVSEGGGSQSNVIRKIDGSGNVTTICGEYQSTIEYADGQGTDSRFLKPQHMAFNLAKNILYVCDSYNNTIREIDLRPKARFFASPSATNVGVPVQMTSQSYNNPTSWSWQLTPATGFTLENGTTLNSENPKFKFTIASTYTVKLTVTNGYGSGDTTWNNYINISNINTTDPPVADFVASDSFIMVGDVVTFSDQSANQPSQWEWAIIPSTHQFENATDKNSQNPQVKFTGVGTYTVILKATNANGSSNKTKSNYIKVDPLGITQIGLNDLLQVYPNPNNGSFTLELDKNISGANMNIQLFDMQGKRIMEPSFEGNQVVVNGLSAGVYMIQVSDGTSSYNQKVVVR